MPVQLKELWVSRSSLTERTGAGTELVGVGVGVAVGVFVGVGMVTLTYSDQGLERPPLSSALTVYQYLVPGVRFECLSDVFVVSRFRSCHPDSPDFHQRASYLLAPGMLSQLTVTSFPVARTVTTGTPSGLGVGVGVDVGVAVGRRGVAVGWSGMVTPT